MLLREKSTQIKEHPSWEASISIQKNPQKTLICLSSSRLVYNRLVTRLFLEQIGKTVFYSSQYKNGCLAGSEFFHMFTQSIKVYKFYYLLLKSTDV